LAQLHIEMVLETLSGADFKRLCGVPRATCIEMVEVVRLPLERQRQRGGQAKLCAKINYSWCWNIGESIAAGFGTGLLTCDR
jgi:hypothetical protein